MEIDDEEETEDERTEDERTEDEIDCPCRGTGEVWFEVEVGGKSRDDMRPCRLHG